MTSSTNFALVFKKVPTAVPIPGEHLAIKDIGDAGPLPVHSNGVFLEHLYASLDPYLRELMINAEAEAALLPGDDLQEGDTVMGVLPVQEFSCFSSKDEKTLGPLTKLDVHSGPDDIRDYLGVLSEGTGLTAYRSFYEIGKPKRGETIFISSAAGAVGQIVGALAKQEGLTVIGSVGSKAKADFLVQELGFDGAFNYKTEKPVDALARVAPSGIDIYFENVGGEQLEAALDKINVGGRIIGCGMISQYNNEVPFGVRNLYQIILKRLTFRGFIVNDEDFSGPWKEKHQEHVTELLKERKLRVTTSEVLGLQNAAEGFVGMLQGKKLGKVVLKIKV